MYNSVETCNVFRRNIPNYYENQASRMYCYFRNKNTILSQRMEERDMFGRRNSLNNQLINRLPLRAEFVNQPPDDLRKSNFFKFSVGLRLSSNDPIEITKARFVRYLNENSNTDLRNGMQFDITVKLSQTGILQPMPLYVTLVDAATNEPIKYEGQDDSPKLRRVLLTHETICTRCSQQKSCGNKNEAPSDPLIQDKGVLKFFLKCNQNCLKTAGNPKDMRRFSVAVSSSEITHDKSSIMALSHKIFVHNNSKHSRKRKREPEIDNCSPPKIVEVYPREGGFGTNICIFGERLRDDMYLYFTNVRVKTKFISDKLVHATVPYMSPGAHALALQIPLGHSSIHCGTFNYALQSNYSAVYIYPRVGVRGEEFMILCQDFKMGDLVVVYNHFRLNSRVVEGSGILSLIPPTMAVGVCEMDVYWNDQLVLRFRYEIQDRNHPHFSQPYGFLKFQVDILIPREDPSPYQELRYISHQSGDYLNEIRSYASSNASSTLSLTGSTQSTYDFSPQYCVNSPSPDHAPLCKTETFVR